MTVMHRGRSEDDAVKPPKPRRIPGLPDPIVPMLLIPDVQGRAHNQVAECRGPAEEVSTTVEVQNSEREAEVARGCRSRRSRRSRHGGGDEVVLDEA